jgi:hypothetical protein
MLKALLPLIISLPIAFTSAIAPIRAASTNQDIFVLEENARGNYTIKGVNPSKNMSKELRIYYDENRLIDEIADTAFDDCKNLQRLMLSYSVTHINSTSIDDIKTLYYTGSEEQFESLALTYSGTVNYYSYDEGFIYYWNTNIRPTTDTSICDMSKESFDIVYKLYSKLSYSDRASVDEYEDIAGEPISDSMKELINLYGKKNPSRSKDEFTQDNAIGVIIVIALIGMTSICVFYLLKTKEVIS